ncbi:hypothetical protein [Hymenobacter sp. PAMC 26628]|uniref:hypothetical protein n=1 Tax=Hymenobacter sp. PAMC 26628 TaxID=1484118 RepID=UPI000A919552|nr:hypothetical protein [Hymenobacter sp. PAMC 26628]
MKYATLVGYALLAVGILLRLLAPGLGVVGTMLAAVGGLTVAGATIAAASKGRR